MFLLSQLRRALRRAAETLKPRTQPASDSIWDQPLSGDAWIGVFLIAVSLLGFYAVARSLWG